VRLFWKCALTPFLLVAATTAGALDLRGDEQDLRLGAHVEVLHDRSGTLALADVVGAGEGFAPPRAHPDLNFGYTDDVVWLRLPVRSRADEAQEWRIEFQYASVDRIDLYDVSAQSTVHQQGGDTMPFAARSQAHRNPVFVLRLAPGEDRTLYFRAHSQGSLTLSSSLWALAAFHRHSEAGYAANALYFGTAIALAAYNLLLFTMLRERTILLYVAFVLSFATGLASVTGFGQQFLWPDAVRFGNRILAVGFALSSLLAALYARAYLDTGRYTPRWHRVLGVLALAHALVLAIALVGPLRLSFQLMSIGGVLNAILILTCGAFCMWWRVPGARVLVLAWSALLLGALLMSLRNFGILPTNFITANAMPIGSGLEMLLLSFGLAARFNELKRQKAEAQAALLEVQQASLRAAREHERLLEQRVAERTDQLEAANARLRELASHDALTGLPNRAALDAHLEAAVERERAQLRVLLIDLDGFKPINDRYGHATGDRVLSLVAQRIRDCVGAGDFAARLGGDEFVVLTRLGEREAEVRALSDRIRDAVATPIALDDGVVRITASIGIAGSDSDNADARALLMRADRAMYAAKAAGGDRVLFASG
jgi:diguanylate cyclase (GGDEF)-like protein